MIVMAEVGSENTRGVGRGMEQQTQRDMKKT